jgi:hypothetical protein
VILAIDQGTTGTTCLVIDREGRVRGRAGRELQQHFPRPGWVEHDAEEIWDLTRTLAAEAAEAAGVGLDSLEGIGITNQRETVVLWDRETGRPVHRALVWQDGRTRGRLPPDEGGGGGGRARADRAGDRPLLQRHQARLAAGPRGRGAGAGGGGGARRRNGRQLADLEDDRRVRCT